MTRYLLDTNIISGLVKAQPSLSLIAWMEDQHDENLLVASMTIAEIRKGILVAPAGRRRDELDAWFFGPEGPQALFAHRILDFDDKAALIWAELMASGQIAGRPRSAVDMIIAAVALANDCVIATANEKDFAGLQFLNPLR